MAQLTLSGDTSGSVGIVVPAVAGSNTVTVPAQTGTLGMMAQGTAVATTSGTSITFTGIPSWAKQITFILSGVSLSGTAGYLIQIGSGSLTNTGYTSASTQLGGSAATATSTAGYLLNCNSATYVQSGSIAVLNVSGNTWVASGVVGNSTGTATITTGGSVTLSGVLDRIAITTTNGTDTFDAGSVNILYQG